MNRKRLLELYGNKWLNDGTIVSIDNIGEPSLEAFKKRHKNVFKNARKLGSGVYGNVWGAVSPNNVKVAIKEIGLTIKDEKSAQDIAKYHLGGKNSHKYRAKEKYCLENMIDGYQSIFFKFIFPLFSSFVFSLFVFLLFVLCVYVTK